MRSDREKDYLSGRETKTHAAATHAYTRVRTRIHAETFSCCSIFTVTYPWPSRNRQQSHVSPTLTARPRTVYCPRTDIRALSVVPMNSIRLRQVILFKGTTKDRSCGRTIHGDSSYERTPLSKSIGTLAENEINLKSR